MKTELESPEYTLPEPIVCCAYERSGGYEYRDVRLAGIPHVGDLVRLRNENRGYDVTLKIEQVMHLSENGRHPRIQLFVRGCSFDIKTGKITES